MRRGDFSELLNPANPYFGRARMITDPQTRAPFPNNIIPVTASALRVGRFSTSTRNRFRAFFRAPPTGLEPSSLAESAEGHRQDRLPAQRQDQPGCSSHAHPFRFNTVLGSTRFVELWSGRTAPPSPRSRARCRRRSSTNSPCRPPRTAWARPTPTRSAVRACQRSTYGVSYPFLFPADSKFDPRSFQRSRINGLSALDNGPYPGFWSGYTYAVSNNVTKVVERTRSSWGSSSSDRVRTTRSMPPLRPHRRRTIRTARFASRIPATRRPRVSRWRTCCSGVSTTTRSSARSR